MKEEIAWAFSPIVAVPARNESRRLPALLKALSCQDWLRTARRRLPVVLVLNNCTDDSRQVVAEAAQGHADLKITVIDVVFVEGDAHVGSARRLAMETASALCEEAERAVILTTDADARPDRSWISANLRHIAAGIDLVGGRLVGDAAEEALLGPAFIERAHLHQTYMTLADRLASLVDPIEHDPWPHHHDHTGGSLAVRADVYRAVGGLPATSCREDLAFVSRVRQAGHRLCHPLDVVVHVSARLNGRAPGGMADCLMGWMRDAETGVPLIVEDPARILARLRRRRRFRMQTVDPALAVSLVEQWAPDEPDAPASCPVEIAIARISTMIAEVTEGVRAA
ncbi:glycosyltransferase [Consotaella aegiceratis]|uniref:glycosyltransferase n=1 Tax=Consotaella aegiceratis TaxID=3097961 RepID=UPI002F409E10